MGLDKFRILGGNRLRGEVEISGAKNAALAIIPAVILSDDVCRIENVPDISDVNNILEMLRQMGVKVTKVERSVYEIDPREINTFEVPTELSRKMRASSYFLGILLAKFGQGSVSMPGGCNLGARPIDQHIKGFRALGADVKISDDGIVKVKADKLKGASVYFDNVTVGATMNIILASTKAEGLTVIENAAKEPHVVDLANFLNQMGADIRGAGTDVIKIRGVKKLKGITYSIIPDQIEAGTYMVAAAATGGDVLIKNVIPKHLETISAKLVEAGATVDEYDEVIRVCRNKPLVGTNVKTMPHPGFPTDMQPQMTVLLSIAEGISIVTEGVWDDRFRYVAELKKMGADISVEGKKAIIQGVSKLNGAIDISAPDLRAGAALIIAGLVADGVTEVTEIKHIQRGYENIIDKLRFIGADISLVKGKDDKSETKEKEKATV
jgi:UDP-N-acetylglucosamine 1-carboxyvinyltransferase